MSSALSRWRNSPGVLSYSVAVLSIAVAVAIDFALVRLVGNEPAVSLFLCAIMFVAWGSGTGPALLATALALLAFEYFLLQPTYSFAIEFNEIPRLIFFALAALFVVSLGAAQRRTETALGRARDEQQETMQELQALNETLVTENAHRKHAEQRARLAEQELRATIDTIPALAARHRADGVIDFVNQTWRRYTGISQASWKDRGGVAIHPDDRPRVDRAWLDALATGEPFETEQRLRNVEGEYRWHVLRRVPLRNDDGEVIAWYGAGYDIEDRKRAEDALQRSQAELMQARHELQLIIDTVPVLVLRHRADGIIDFVNQVGRSYTGLASGNWARRTSIATHPDDVPRLEQAWDIALATGEPFETEQRLRRADGEYRWFITRRVPLRDPAGDVIAWYAAVYDVEDWKRAEDALRRSEADLAKARQDLQLMIDSIPVMVSTFEPDGTRSFVNRTWQDYTGHSQREATGKGLDTTAYFHPDDVERFESAWRASQVTGEMLSVDVRNRRADGAYRWYALRRAPQRDAKGHIVKWYSVGIDVEDQRIAEEALRRSEAWIAKAERELRRTLDLIPILAWRTRPDGYAEYLNNRWLDYTGLSPEQALGWEWRTTIHPDDRPALNYAWLRMIETGKPDEVEARMRRFDGVYRWFLFRSEALRDDAGAIVAWYGTNIDIEDRKQAESAWQRSQAYSAEAQKLSQTGSFAWEVATRDYYWSEQTYQILGFDRSVKPSISLVVQRTHPEDRYIMERELDRSAQRVPYHDFEVRLLMPDGQIKRIHLLAHRITYQSGNEEVVGAVMDVTEARKSQETLHAVETALAHASRVATLGEISATIAHEVNQPLAAIIANGQACLRFLRRETPDLDEVRGAVEWIVKDGNRAGEVIRRVRGLLKKADTERTPLDVNELVNEVAALLRRELAAQRVVSQLELAPCLPAIVADRIQLQQVIINLVMNGAEAMQTVTDRPPQLMIRTYRDETDRVVVAVEDCGPGLAGENADRVFDPFFSTKPGGLGMGLSICRSIVEAHGGRLWSSANAGPGATFQFGLPAHRESAA